MEIEHYVLTADGHDGLSCKYGAIAIAIVAIVAIVAG